VGFCCLARIVNFDRDKQDPQNFRQREIQLNIGDNNNLNQCVNSFEINFNLIPLLKIQGGLEMLNSLARRYGGADLGRSSCHIPGRCPSTDTKLDHQQASSAGSMGAVI